MTRTEQYQRRKRMAETVRNGLTLAETAERFQMSLNCVRTACHEHQVPIKDTYHKYKTASGYRIIAALQNTKLSIRAISDQFRVSRQYVYEVYDKSIEAGIKMPDREIKRRYR